MRSMTTKYLKKRYLVYVMFVAIGIGNFFPQIAVAQIGAADEFVEVSSLSIYNSKIHASTLRDGFQCEARSIYKTRLLGATLGGKEFPSLTDVIPVPSGKTFAVEAPGLINFRPSPPLPHTWIYNIRKIMFCPESERDNIYQEGSVESPTPEVNKTLGWLLYAFELPMMVAASIGLWILAVSSYLTGNMLTAGQFITDPFVSTGWPFVQGIANLGFIIVLLFIAFATTVQLDIGSGGIRRLLPRLLIAALLINFSLVLGGILIDASRLTNAALVTVVGGKLDRVDNIGFAILNNSGTFNTVFKSVTRGSITVNRLNLPRTWETPFRILQATLVIWMMALGFGLVALLLLARHIILILLLIVSPIAYISLVLPQTSGFGKWWWSNFIKWVIYGPIVLFILILITIPNSGSLTKDGNFLNGIFNVLLTFAMLMAAALASRKLSAVGANGIVSFAAKRGKQIGQVAAQHPILAGAALAIPTGGVSLAAGAAIAGARGASFATKKGIEKLYKAPYEYAGGVVRAGAERVFGKKSAAARGYERGAKIFKPETAAEKELRQRRETEGEKTASDLASSPLTAMDDISSRQLSDHNFTKKLYKANPANISLAASNANMSQLEGLVANVNLMKQLTEQERNDLEKTIDKHADPKIRSQDKARLIKTLNSTINTADKELVEGKKLT